MSEAIRIRDKCVLGIEDKFGEEILGCKYWIRDEESNEAIGLSEPDFDRLALHSPLVRKMVELLKDDKYISVCYGCGGYADHCFNKCRRQDLLSDIAALERGIEESEK